MLIVSLSDKLLDGFSSLTLLLILPFRQSSCCLLCVRDAKTGLAVDWYILRRKK